MWQCSECNLRANVGPDDFPLTCSCGARHELGKSRGLGDTIAKLTKAVGIQPCGGCEERRQKLNSIFPFADGGNPGK